MRLTVNKLTALHIMREMRASGHVLPRAHVGLLPPDPEPHKRWTKTALQLDALRLSAPPDASHKLYVAVPAQSARLKATFASNTVYEAGLPIRLLMLVGECAFPVRSCCSWRWRA